MVLSRDRTRRRSAPNIPNPFSEADLQRLRKFVSDDVGDTASFTANRKYFDGDHWQNEEGWIGPRPADGEVNAQTVLAMIQKQFVSKNTIREVVQRHLAALLGRQPNWRLTLADAMGVDGQLINPTNEPGGATVPPRRGTSGQPPRATPPAVPPPNQPPAEPAEGEEPPEGEELEDPLIAEAEAALTIWWDERNVLSDLALLTENLLLTGRGGLRLFVPPAFIEGGTVETAELPESLDKIYVKVPAPEQIAVVVDENTQFEAAIFVAAENAADTGLNTANIAAEISFVEGEETVIRVFRKDGIDEARLIMGGNLTSMVVKRPILITEQIRQHQKLQNMALSMMARNVELAGFLERIILNAQMPGKFEMDEETGVKKFVPDKFRIGAGTTNVLTGVRSVDEDGNEAIAQPNVIYRDPVPVETFKDTSREAYRGILEESHQMHAMISGDATTSGDSRRQAMADFIADLLFTKQKVDQIGRWLLQATLSMAALFSGDPDRYSNLRVEFNTLLSPGPLSAEEMRVIVDLVREELMSRQTGMARLGIDDVDAELHRIMVEFEERSERTLAMQAAAFGLENPEGEEIDNGDDPRNSPSDGNRQASVPGRPNRRRFTGPAGEVEIK